MFHVTIFWPNERLLEFCQFSYLFVFFHCHQVSMNAVKKLIWVVIIFFRKKFKFVAQVFFYYNIKANSTIELQKCSEEVKSCLMCPN